MKFPLILMFFFLFLSKIEAQSIYKSPLGFNLTFDKTWKRLPKEILIQKAKEIKDFLQYRKDIQFDACYQKIGNSDMDYPYILFKNILSTPSGVSEIKNVQDIFTNKNELNKTIQNVINGKFSLDITIGKNYYDNQNKIMIFTYDMGLSIKGNLVSMVAFYFGKNASIMINCYSYKDEFKYDQKEFLDVIYSIKENEMANNLSEYSKKHDIAVHYFNQGKLNSESNNRLEAIKNYSKAIENYPSEDYFIKAEAYYNRGFNKRNIKDIKGAIADYTQAIKLRPDYYKAYNNRGFAKALIEDYLGAISDYNLAIKYDNYNSEYTSMALGNRGIAKLTIGNEGCPDLKKAYELGNKSVLTIINEYCK